MIKVQLGEVFDLDEAKKGNSNGKAWGFIEKKAEKGYDTLKIWIDNPSAVGECVVEKIINASVNNRKVTKRDGTEVWVKDFAITASFKPLAAVRGVPVEVDNEFAAADDEELPF